jgi:splicing factor 3A subunit 1
LNHRIVLLAVIDRTALFVARSANPPLFEDKIRENQRQDPKFSFLHPVDPYHAYYRDRMDKIQRGELDETDVAKEDKESGETQAEKKPVDLGKEPPHPEYILDLPNISAIDLYVVSRSFQSVTLISVLFLGI